LVLKNGRNPVVLYQERRMDFISGALPNVMFIAGLIAIGIGLGIEFKIVEIKGELSKPGRIGAIGVGALLVLSSMYLYTRPPQPASAPATAAGVQVVAAQANGGGVVSAPQQSSAQPAATQAAGAAVLPSATALPASPTPVPPTATATPAPSATPVPPTATATSAPAIAQAARVPDIHGKNVKEADKILAAAGLQLGEQKDRCEDIGVREVGRRVKKGQIRCQSAAPASTATPGQRIDYVLSDDGD